jgi:hypothetical protein
VSCAESCADGGGLCVVALGSDGCVEFCAEGEGWDVAGAEVDGGAGGVGLQAVRVARAMQRRVEKGWGRRGCFTVLF